MDIAFYFLLFGGAVFITSTLGTVAFGDDKELERLGSMNDGDIDHSDHIHERHSLSLDDLSEEEDLLNRFLETRNAKVGQRNFWLTYDPIMRAPPPAPTTIGPPPISTVLETKVPKVPSIPKMPTWHKKPKLSWG